jgi:hypothetical protein
MKFTLSTKPLVDALDLTIINANISNQFARSTMVELTATSNTLQINVEASSICAQAILKGTGDEMGPKVAFVSSALFKQLIGTLEASQVTLEYVEGGIIVHAGSHQFTFSNIVDATDMHLKTPVTEGLVNPQVVDKGDWKFINDYQDFAISESFIHPVYTRVWVGANSNVLTGDFDVSLFTKSEKNKLGITCLLKETIVNLFNQVPDGTQIYQAGTDLVLVSKTDSVEFTAQITPQYESDESVGSYNSDIILSLMTPDVNGGVKVNTAPILKLLSQADLLRDSVDDTVNVTVTPGSIHIVNRKVDGTIPVDEDQKEPVTYTLKFRLAHLKSILSNLPEDKVTLTPVKQEDSIIGILFTTTAMTSILAGVDD